MTTFLKSTATAAVTAVALLVGSGTAATATTVSIDFDNGAKNPDFGEFIFNMQGGIYGEDGFSFAGLISLVAGVIS